ncbi:DUF2726 domain-containing protein [Aeromonas enteropelogenes]|uniref:DUF2726 domain-containing protein n=1 Tax=Aeromonas enteropelogenes TaxID=29489 RepID=UPI0005A6AB1F|nr:DUF2726 domain-containing protein [Aeromonas enteropelogenes]UBH57569.1 DUF2726 domain-containing protein [Aeromonas enteropelogenes]
MNILILSGLLLLALLVLAIVWRRGRRPQRLPYELQETLLNPAERAFLTVLEQAAGEQARVFAKVPVADVLAPQAALGKGKWQQYAGKIGGKHFDYLLCHPADLSFVCAIELDDSGPRHQKRKVRDSFLKAACDGAGFPLLQIPAGSHYLVEDLREQLQPLLTKRREPQADELLPGERREPTFNPLLLDGVDVEGKEHKRAVPLAGLPSTEPELAVTRTTVVSEPAEEELAALLFEDPEDDEEQDAPHCPRCDAPLVEREAKKGPHAGRLFLACSRFPECRYAAPHHSRH